MSTGPQMISKQVESYIGELLSRGGKIDEVIDFAVGCKVVCTVQGQRLVAHISSNGIATYTIPIAKWSELQSIFASCF